ncbi:MULTISPECIES: hypothetical protein [unclassified Haladaptatus]|nr:MULTISPECIES: hypothetical protein [unclassified Haladaptatus]
MGICPYCENTVSAVEEVIEEGQILVSQWVCPTCDYILGVAATDEGIRK